MIIYKSKKHGWGNSYVNEQPKVSDQRRRRKQQQKKKKKKKTNIKKKALTLENRQFLDSLKNSTVS